MGYDLSGRERHIPRRVRKLADLALRLPYACRQLEEQVLRGGELGNDARLRQRQLQNWLDREHYISFFLQFSYTRVILLVSKKWSSWVLVS